MIDSARVFINDAAERVEHETKRAIAAIHEGDMLTTQMAVLKRFAKRARWTRSLCAAVWPLRYSLRIVTPWRAAKRAG